MTPSRSFFVRGPSAAIKATEVVLAKKYTFEAKRLVTHPEIEVTPEQCSYVGSIWLRAWTAQFRQELKQPGFDHWKSLIPSNCRTRA
jgi:hypothetical protein